jgi:hypothetical protein
VSFGKMATLLFCVAGLLALVSLAILPGAPSLSPGSGSRGDGKAVVSPQADEAPPVESAPVEANPVVIEGHGTGAILPVDFGAVPRGGVDSTPADPIASVPMDGAVSDEPPDAVQARAPQPGPAAPDQPAAPRAQQIQAAPQVSFVPGQPMMDTNPSR